MVASVVLRRPVYCTVHLQGCWARLQAEGGEDEPKKYKRANLGLSNQLYYNDEVGNVAYSS
jgi:hypothetical protein